MKPVVVAGRMRKGDRLCSFSASYRSQSSSADNRPRHVMGSSASSVIFKFLPVQQLREKTVAGASGAGKDERPDKQEFMAKKKAVRMPAHISPMLCTLVKEPPDMPGYLYEIKWDGYRIIAFVGKGSVRMDSRSGLDYTKKISSRSRCARQVVS